MNNDATVAVALPLHLPDKSPAVGRVRDYVELTKFRLSLLVLLTTGAGFYLASKNSICTTLLIHTLLGTALVAWGASAINQYLESDIDGKMDRTCHRPLPSGRIAPNEALLTGGLLVIAGLSYLVVKVNALTGLLAFLSAAIYLLLYTPLKRKTTLNTVMGAVSGAIPPMIGWTAARGEINYETWILFAILFLWQIPHFLSIAWLYREDYARGGLKMLPVVDVRGESTGRQIALHCHALLAVSLLPTIVGLAGPTYLWGALLLGSGFLLIAIGVAVSRTELSARRSFVASIIYLVLLFALMTADKI